MRSVQQEFSIRMSGKVVVIELVSNPIDGEPPIE